MRPPHTTAYQNALADVLEHPDWPALPELDFGQTSAQPPASTSSVTICRTKRKSEKPRTTEVKAANAQDKTADKQLSVPLR
jgi:hypothetical protein